jgi:MFS transporter, Spinster family, sphingosine-1-phosphate transporter
MSQSETQSPKRMSTAWLVVALLFPVALLNYLDRQMIASMKSSVIAEIPMSEKRGSDTEKDSKVESLDEEKSPEELKKSYENTNWGHMLGQFKWVYAIFSPIGGFLADRISRRFTICCSLAVWSVITFITGTVTTYEGLLWTRTLMGVSEAFYIPAALALIADYHVGHTRSRAVGIHQMGIYCGVILGGFAGYAADSPDFGWRGAFRWIGLIGIVYAIPLFAVLRDVRYTSASNDSAGQNTRLLSSLLLLFTNVSFLLLIAYFTLPALAGWVVRDWMPSILKDSFQIGQGKAGVSATLYWQLAAIVAAFAGGALADAWMKRNPRGRIYVSAIGMSLIIPALFLVGAATNGGTLTMAILALILFGIGWGFFDCNNMPILCQIVRPELRATGYGLMNMVSISCGGFADKIFGVLKDQKVPTVTIFGVFALICLVSVLLVLLIRPRSDAELAGS